VLGAERLRVAGRAAVGAQTELWTCIVFLLAVAFIVAAAVALYRGG
jgi:hypothetical protein